MFIELHCFDGMEINLHLMVAIDSIESFEREITIDEKDRAVFEIWVHLKSGESHLLQQCIIEDRIQETWQKLGNIVGCTERIDLS